MVLGPFGGADNGSLHRFRQGGLSHDDTHERDRRDGAPASCCPVPTQRRQGPWLSERRRRPVLAADRGTTDPSQCLSAAIELKDQYCTDIPKEGDTFLVVDLVDPALRNEPVGMQIMKGNGSKNADGQIVADIRPSTHPDGVLRGDVRLDEGLYTVIIATEKQNLMRRPQYLLRVRMTDYQQLVQTIVVPLLGMLFAAWLLYKLIQSTWLRNWWTGLRS